MPAFTSLGDLSRAAALRSASSRTKQLLTVLSREMSTGRKDDIPAALGGDTRRLASIEHRLQMLDSYRRNCSEIEGRFDAGQTAMEALHGIASGLGITLIGTSMLTGTQAMNATLADARNNFDAAVGKLNTQVGGEYIFAGARSATRPVAEPQAMIDALTTAVSGLTDVGDVIAAVDDFFDAPPGGGGFIDLAYSGSLSGAGQVAISPDRSVGSETTAATPEFRELLKGLALASLVAEGRIASDPADRLQFVQAAGQRIVNAGDKLTLLRARHGVLQEAVELARTRNEAETSAIKITRNGMVRADEYETATALAEAQVQLETLYAVTARLSQLSLAKRL